MTLRPLRDRLRDPAPLIAAFSIIRSVEIVEIMALAGFDAVILDLEHGPYGIEAAGPLVVAARSCGLYPIIRVQRNDAAMIGAALDVGAAGVLVPQVASAAEARAAVSAARFAPEGTRGANSWVRAAGFAGGPDWFARANAEAAVIVMIEGRQGAEAAPDILRTPSLDGVFLGPVDLSHALGVPGRTDHPLVVARMGAVMAEAREQGRAAAVFAPTVEAARRWLGHGAGMVAVGVDTGHILAALTAVAGGVRDGASDP